MNKTLVVAKWEYLEKVRSKAFIIGLFLMPMIIALTSILPSLLAGKEDESTKLIGIVDATSDQLGSVLTTRMEKYRLSNGNPNYIIRPIASGKTVDIAEACSVADKQILKDEIEGYIILTPGIMQDSVVEYRSRDAGDIRLTTRLQSNLKSVLLDKKLAEKGLDPALAKVLRAPLDVKTVKVSKSGAKEETDFMRTFFSAFIPLMMLFNLFITSGQLLVRSLLDEKSNRIVEVLVSSCRPVELMSGKLLGLCALGLTQIGFWALIALAGLASFGSMSFPPANQLLLVMVYSVLGYLFYSAIFIALGSPVTTEQEAQQINSYLVLFLVLPIALVLPIILQPNAVWVKVLSFIPIFTPTFMVLRLLIKMPSAIEIISTIIILLLSTYVMMIAAGRIFRVAILATGKRPGMREVMRWVREG